MLSQNSIVSHPSWFVLFTRCFLNHRCMQSGGVLCEFTGGDVLLGL